MHLIDSDIQFLVRELNSLKERIEILEKTNVLQQNLIDDMINESTSKKWCHPESSMNLPDL